MRLLYLMQCKFMNLDQHHDIDYCIRSIVLRYSLIRTCGAQVNDGVC